MYWSVPPPTLLEETKIDDPKDDIIDGMVTILLRLLSEV